MWPARRACVARGSSAPAEMRPACWSVRWNRAGFLRPRGDAPFCRRRSRTRARVPPPPRRCALQLEARHASGSGSSAPAEMRPSTTSTSAWSRWFLRPRGDAPARHDGCRGAAAVPPPPRRCAARPHDGPQAAVGSSAPAEMRPASAASATPTGGFLRPRGDAPSRPLRRHRRTQVPPPPRRCAAKSAARGRFRGGSSAPAEMRPQIDDTVRDAVRFLRPRGDAPRGSLDHRAIGAVPPPPRRCAVPHQARRLRSRGSSAPAEMRRASGSPDGVRPGFLRPRGDAPLSGSGLQVARMVPPPPRRCASRELRSARTIAGSSAPAEMRRSSRRWSSSSRRFLRPRGDAPAAMAGCTSARRVPPPPRRCARAPTAFDTEAVGSSAPAEMRRIRPRQRPRVSRFLRPRGDAPGSAARSR